MASALEADLKRDLAQIRFLLKKNPAAAYALLSQKGVETGKRFGVRLVVNFPHKGKIEQFDMYGRRDVSIIMDQKRTRFPISRNLVKKAATDSIRGAECRDAYMYEGKEGVKVFFEGGRIDVLPHSLHVWCEFTPSVTGFCDWLMQNVYGMDST